MSYSSFSSSREDLKCKLFGKDVLCDPKFVTFNEETGKLHIPNNMSNESSVRKMYEVNTPTKYVYKQISHFTYTMVTAECNDFLHFIQLNGLIYVHINMA